MSQKKTIEVRFRNWDCILIKSKYANGRIALALKDASTGEPVAKATVNLPDEPLEDEERYTFIKNYSENHGMIPALYQAGVIDGPIRDVSTGYSVVWVCKILV